MGSGYWSSTDWSRYKASRNINQNSTIQDIYKATGIKDNLNPFGVTYRESCDSTDHPQATAIIVGLDVTGSMGYLSETIAKESLNTLITEIYDREPVRDPQLMFMAIGDAYTDRAPLQVTQFEADIRIAEQLMDIYFEGGGGGNGGESYLLTWYFAARHTKIDCFEKRGQKGYLFTIGDECNHGILTREQVKRVFGDDISEDLTAKQLLGEVSRQYEVFHLLVGNYEGHNSLQNWRGLLGERAMEVTDYTKLAEIMESTMEVLAGKTVADTVRQWDGSTALVVQDAISGLVQAKENNGLVEF